MRVVILNAGKSTRLGGKNKLLVEAGGAPVHRWHLAAHHDAKIAVVTNGREIAATMEAMPEVDHILAHDQQDGPVGALAAYLAITKDEHLIVAYADTLIAPQILPLGDWVGVAPVIHRTWDHRQPDGTWAKVTPSLRVGIGLYAFADLGYLRDCIAELGTKNDQHLPVLLNLYERRHPMRDLEVVGWHDAGDPDALARVPTFRNR